MTASTASLESRILPLGALDAATVDAMFALFKRYFVDSRRGVFERDLAGKEQVILLYADGVLVGFSTVQLGTETCGGQKVAVLFSGDTIIDRQHWGSGELERCWLQVALDARARFCCPLYWLLISSGYRTYRFLPVFFREFWPRHDRPTPATEQGIIDQLARQRFDGAYRDGIVRDGCGRLRGDVSPIAAGRLNNPHIAFFATRNPGHLRGDALVCITRIDEPNLTRAGHGVLRSLQ